MSNFNYNVDIPDGPHNPSADQPLMKTNTNSTKSIIGVDHYTFQEDSRDGTHKQVNLTNESSPPLLSDLVLYSKLAGGVSALWAKNITGIDVPIFINALGLSNGYTTLFGGFYLQWGTYNASGGNFSSGSTTSSTGGNTVVTFPVAFPNNVFFFGGNLTYTNSNLPSGTGTLNIHLSEINSGSKTSFQWQVYTNTNNYLGFVWYAIGN